MSGEYDKEQSVKPMMPQRGRYEEKRTGKNACATPGDRTSAFGEIWYTTLSNVRASRGFPRAEAISRIMISLTPVATTKVKEIMSMQTPVPVALRVAVVGGGCSGFQYHMAFENQTSKPTMWWISTG
jgi:hypothetical protein